MIELYNGDCLEVMQLLIDKGVKVDAVIADLPYGITRNKWDSPIDLNKLWPLYKAIIKDNGVICLFASSPFDKILACSNLSMFRYEWIWQKDNGTGFLNAHKMPLKVHENILIFYKHPPLYNPIMRKGFKPYTILSKSTSSNYGKMTGHFTVSNGERYPIDILKFPRDSSSRLHPTQKPVALLEYLIKTYTNDGDTVLDNAIGSGSTGVACKHLNRNFIGIEIDKEYFDIAKERIDKE